MKILVTGGAGYVGGSLCDLLISEGHDVRIYDSLLYEDMYLKDVDFQYGDILDIESLNSHFAWADAVVWLAALVGDPACALNEQLSYKINTFSINNLVKNFEGKIVFPSTCSVYGAQESLLNEESPVMPLSIYAQSKIQAEKIFQDKAADRTIIFRLGTLYGISDSYSRMRSDLVVNTLSFKAVQDNALTVFGGAQYRPLLHVRDVGTAVSSGLKLFEPGVYNLHEVNLTIIEIANKIKKIAPHCVINTTETTFQDSRNYKVDGAKVRNVLKFTPSYNIDDGIKKLIEVAKSKRVKNPYIDRFINSKHLESTF